MNDEWKERLGPIAALVIGGAVVVYLLLEAFGAAWLPTSQSNRRTADATGPARVAATALTTGQSSLRIAPTTTPGALSPTLTTNNAMPATTPIGVAPTPTASELAPTATPDGRSPTDQVSANAPPPLQTIFEADFTDPQPQWPNNPQSTAWFADNAYHLWARQPTLFVAVGAPMAAPLGDVAVTATFRKVGGPPGGGYGIIVRDVGTGPRDGIDQGGRYYVVEVSDRREVGIWRREEDHWIDLLPWAPSQAVLPGDASNELTLQAIGEHLTLLVNGTQVASVVDSALPAGGVGVFVGGDMNEVALMRFAVNAPGRNRGPPHAVSQSLAYRPTVRRRVTTALGRPPGRSPH